MKLLEKCSSRGASIAAALMLIVGLVFGAGPIRAASVTATFEPHAKGSARTVDHSAWNELLAAHLVAGADGINRLDYVRLNGAPHGRLKSYIAELEKVDVAALDRPEQQAFWINLYNAVGLDAVLARYPVASINDVSLADPAGQMQTGPWKAKLVTVAGVALSLDDIENAIVRAVFKDARAHYALNCLSIGCPNMRPVALTGANLEAQFESASREFVNHPRAISFGADGKVTASSVYEWFDADFGGFEGIVAHMAKYAEAPLKTKLAALKAIDAYTYDWALADLAK